MMNKKVKRFRSTPLNEQPSSEKKSFKVRKSMTMELKTTNIILIEPPKDEVKEI